MESLAALDRDCSAIAGLFQIIVNDLKNSGPMWEDFLTKASKLQHALKSTLVVFSSFLDAFQRIADSATHTRGATKDVGAALTRLSLRHRAIETRIKNLTNTLTCCLVIPLQEKLDEWRRTHHALDKDHTKEYKRARADIKKRIDNASKLQKKAKKAGKSSELNKVVATTVADLVARYGALEETERTALKNALTEERSRYCNFALALKPVLEEEVGLVSELTHIQEVLEQLEKHSADPYVLPPASEQVLEDVKSGDSKWSWQTPPSSPASSLGSRKSSMCSISSLNSSSSSSTHSPSHHARARSGLRLVNGSSQDSGFTSQDTLNRPLRPVSFAFSKTSGLSETSCSDGSHTPSPAAPTTATWPNLTDSTLQHKSASATGLHMLTDRPHTISSAYERGKDRPPLTVYTFQPPDGRSGPASPQISSQPASPVCYEMEGGNISPLVGLTATISRRSSRNSLQQALSSSSQESLNNKPKPPIPNRCASLERPSIPDKKASVRQVQQQQAILHNLQMKEQQSQKHKNESQTCASSSETTSTLPDFHKAAPDMILPQPLYSNMSELKNDLSGSHPITIVGEMNESDGSSHASIGSSGYGSQPNMALDHMSRLEDCEASRYCTLRPHSLAVFPQSVVFSSQDFHNSGFIHSRSGSLRRGQKPPPPVRRTPSLTPATSTSSLVMNSFPNIGLSASASSASLNSSTSTVLSSPLSGRSNGSPSQSCSNDSSANVSPLQKTDSESSTPVGSMENLPPPPAFLLEEGYEEEDGNDNTTTPEGILCTSEMPFKTCQVQAEAIQLRKISVSETVKTLQEICHQPSSPITHRRTQSLRMAAPPPQLRKPTFNDERKHSLDGPRAALISSLNAKLAISNPVLGSLQRQKSPIQQMIPIYAQNPIAIQKGNLSPKLQRCKLTSVQEDVAYGNNNQTSSFIHIKDGSSLKAKSIAMHPQTHAASSPSGKGSPKSTPVISRVESSESRGQTKRQSTNHDPFIQSLNMVLAQRAGGAEQQPVSVPSPKTKNKRRSVGSFNGATSNASLQRSGSSASEKASKVRNWISNKKGVNSEVASASLRESLLDQIRKGTVLRRPKHVADRSAPRVH